MFDPNKAPSTLAEWNQLIQYKVNEQQEIYDNAVTEATTQATTAWNKIATARKAELLTTMTKTEANTQLAKEKAEYIANAVSIIEQPLSKEQIEVTYEFLKPQEVPVVEVEDNTPTSIIDLGGKYWDISEGKFIEASEVDHNKVIILGCEPTLENLKQFIAYIHSNHPSVPVVTDAIITEEKFNMLRKARIPLLEEYDAKVMQLNRLIRENPSDSSYTTKRTEWDEYATALANITTLAGAPWDGGGSETPWPSKPE